MAYPVKFGGLLVGLLLAVTPAVGQSVKETRADLDLPTQDTTPAGGVDLAQAVKQIITGTNQFRKQEDRPELKGNDKLSQAARYFAHYMARTDKYGHDADGRQPWERAELYGYDYCIVLENIAYQSNPAGFTPHKLAQGFLNGWKESPGHRKNLLDPDVTDLGVAVAHSGDTGRYYAVQMFGRPKSLAIAFQITNQTKETVAYTVDDQNQTLAPGYTITHRRCRPPNLRFQATPSGKTPESEQVPRPDNGVRYVVREGKAGHYTVVKE